MAAATGVAVSNYQSPKSPQRLSGVVAPAAEDALAFAYWFSHSITVAYQNWLFCGFKIQWPSSGNCTSFEGTFICCNAVNKLLALPDRHAVIQFALSNQRRRLKVLHERTRRPSFIQAQDCPKASHEIPIWETRVFGRFRLAAQVEWTRHAKPAP